MMACIIVKPAPIKEESFGLLFITAETEQLINFASILIKREGWSNGKVICVSMQSIHVCDGE